MKDANDTLRRCSSGAGETRAAVEVRLQQRRRQRHMHFGRLRARVSDTAAWRRAQRWRPRMQLQGAACTTAGAFKAARAASARGKRRAQRRLRTQHGSRCACGPRHRLHQRRRRERRKHGGGQRLEARAASKAALMEATLYCGQARDEGPSPRPTWPSPSLSSTSRLCW